MSRTAQNPGAGRAVPAGGRRLPLRPAHRLLYNEADGKLYFHGAKEGHKIDASRACDKASFCIHDEGVRMDGEWPLHFRSVIVFGRIAPVTDEAATALACKELSRKFTPDDEYFNKEYAAAKDRVLCLALTPEHITGKRIKEN